MVHLMLCAFVTAGLADVGASGANGFGVFAATGHRRGRHLADLGAIYVQRDASRHGLDILLLQAGSRAMVASHGAGIAGFDARIEFLVRHFRSPGYGYRRAGRAAQRRKNVFNAWFGVDRCPLLRLGAFGLAPELLARTESPCGCVTAF